MRAPRRLVAGFTLIELLVVLAVMALLMSIVAPRTIDHVERAREATLRGSLKEMRAALDQFEADRGRPPASLDELVQQRYLRELPVDPITERRDTWVTIAAADDRPAPTVRGATSNEPPIDGVVDVRSGADGLARDGTPYRQW